MGTTMGDTWMKPGLSPEEDLSLTMARRAVPRLNRQDLERQLDRALVDLAQTRQTLSDACRCIAELELREAVGGGQRSHHQFPLLRLFRQPIPPQDPPQPT